MQSPSNDNRTHRFGPDLDVARVSQAALRAGFGLASRDVVLVVPEGIEDAVEEDAVAWTGVNECGLAMLVVDLPRAADEPYRGGFDLAAIKAYEAQRSWPSYTDQISVAVPLVGERLDISPGEVLALLRAPDNGFEIIVRIESLGLGRAGTVEIIAHQPIRADSLEMAMEVVARGVPLNAHD